MGWEKRGRIFDPQEFGLHSHAQVPTVYVGRNEINVYFSSRIQSGKSLVYRATFDKKDLTRLIHFYEEPLMTLGVPGTFDDDGVMPGYCIATESNEVWLYYSGWNQRLTVPYHNSMGLAISRDDGESFVRAYEGPIMDRCKDEPYLAVTPSVIKESHIWKMWYVSGISWKKIEDKFEPIYVIKYAESEDGVDWQRFPETSIKQNYSEEAFSHPNVIYKDGLYHMWYCYRGSRDYRNGKNSYQMGYSTSVDGIKWDRNDKDKILSTSNSGWDSMMICYPYIFQIEDKIYMIYNGNGFGETGFGLAEWG